MDMVAGLTRYALRATSFHLPSRQNNIVSVPFST